jgi:hypothetical protein
MDDAPAGRVGLEADPQTDHAGHDVIDLTASSPDNNQPSPGDAVLGEPQNSGAGRSGSEPFEQGRSRLEPEVIDLTRDSSEESGQPGPSSSNQNVGRALPTLPQSASGSSNSSHRSAGPGSPSFQRRPATPPSPPPASRRRTSSNAFAATRASHPQQRPPESRRPSDLVLPRWQPDAEVTFCPICHTQFSIFIRKHHCRLVSWNILDPVAAILTLARPENVGEWFAILAHRTASLFLISISSILPGHLAQEPKGIRLLS